MYSHSSLFYLPWYLLPFSKHRGKSKSLQLSGTLILKNTKFRHFNLPTHGLFTHSIPTLSMFCVTTGSNTLEPQVSRLHAIFSEHVNVKTLLLTKRRRNNGCHPSVAHRRWPSVRLRRRRRAMFCIAGGKAKAWKNLSIFVRVRDSIFAYSIHTVTYVTHFCWRSEEETTDAIHLSHADDGRVFGFVDVDGQRTMLLTNDDGELVAQAPALNDGSRRSCEMLAAPGDG